MSAQIIYYSSDADPSSYLVHHGIKGQKWGVRRYQNFDGSYTKAGLERYGQSKAKYEESRSQYKKTRQSGDKEQIRAARKQMRADRKQMNKDYKHLKQDKLGDQGKELYANGERITSGNNALALKLLGTFAAVTVTKLAVQRSSLASTTLVNKFGAFNMADVAAAAVGATGLAVNVGMRVNQANKDKKLRAYYGHSNKY